MPDWRWFKPSVMGDTLTFWIFSLTRPKQSCAGVLVHCSFLVHWGFLFRHSCKFKFKGLDVPFGKFICGRKSWGNRLLDYPVVVFSSFQLISVICLQTLQNVWLLRSYLIISTPAIPVGLASHASFIGMLGWNGTNHQYSSLDISFFTVWWKLIHMTMTRRIFLFDLIPWYSSSTETQPSGMKISSEYDRNLTVDSLS